MSLLNTPEDPRHEVPNPMKKGPFRYFALSAVIVAFLIVFKNYGALPDEIPVHFNAKGEIDGYGSKAMLWILPVISAGIYALLGWTGTLRNYGSFNYPVAITEENAFEQHRIALQILAAVRLVVCLLLAYLAYAIVRSALAEQSLLNPWVMGGMMALLFGVIGWGLKASYDAK